MCEQRILVWPSTWVHDNGPLLGSISIPEVNHQDKPVNIDGTEYCQLRA